MDQPSAEVTRLLNGELSPGAEPEAHARAVGELEGQLKRIAWALARSHTPDIDRQPTALVNEALVRMFQRGQVWPDRKTFFSYVSGVIARFLCDQHRRRRRQQTLQEGDRLAEPGGAPGGALDYAEMLDALQGSLAELARKEEGEGWRPRADEVFQIRYFGSVVVTPAEASGDYLLRVPGRDRLMEFREVADICGCSPATAYRAWARAIRWLRAALGDFHPGQLEGGET